MKLIKETKNDLLKRKEIQFIIESPTNPGIEVCKKAITENLKVSEEDIAIKFIKNNFGTHEFLIEVFVYDSKKDKERIEPKPKVKKKTGGA